MAITLIDRRFADDSSALSVGHDVPMSLDELKTLTDILSALVTALAVVVGGLWAYFKLIRGRTFRPHVEVDVLAEWLGKEGHRGIKISVQLKNIGAAKIELLQNGSGMRVKRLSQYQNDPPAEAVWDDFGGVYEVFLHHEWIEPGETVIDDLMLVLGPEQIIEVETRIILAWKPSNVVVHSRRICSAATQATEILQPITEGRSSEGKKAIPEARETIGDETMGGGQGEG